MLNVLIVWMIQFLKKNALIIFFSKMKSISLNLAKPIFQIFNRLEEDASKEKRLNTARKFNHSIFCAKTQWGIFQF